MSGTCTSVGYTARGLLSPQDGRGRSLFPQCYPKEREMVDQTGIEPVTS